MSLFKEEGHKRHMDIKLLIQGPHTGHLKQVCVVGRACIPSFASVLL